MDMSEEQIIKNIIEIRNKQRITQDYVARFLEISHPSYSRIENGSIALSYKKLAEIASCFQMSVIDIITYPKRFVSEDSSAENNERISVTFEVSPDKRDYLLKLVTGEK